MTTPNQTPPLVCLRSNGGVFDDVAFAAGVQFADIFNALSALKPVVYSQVVFSDLLLQLDLLAMAAGYVTTVVMCPDARFSVITFTRPPIQEGASPDARS